MKFQPHARPKGVTENESSVAPMVLGFIVGHIVFAVTLYLVLAWIAHLLRVPQVSFLVCWLTAEVPCAYGFFSRTRPEDF